MIVEPAHEEPQSGPAVLTAVEETAEVKTETEDGRKIIHIKPPIIVKDLAAQLGLKNFQLIKELMDDFNIFANPNLTVEPEVATKVCDKAWLCFRNGAPRKRWRRPQGRTGSGRPAAAGDREGRRAQAAGTGCFGRSARDGVAIVTVRDDGRGIPRSMLLQAASLRGIEVAADAPDQSVATGVRAGPFDRK